MMDEFAALREQMVVNQIERRGVKDPRVLRAMREVPRHVFVPHELWEDAYADSPIRIGHEQTISQPYIVALMTELLRVRPGDKVLEVGTGSGYQAAVLGELAAEVHTIERFPELAHSAKTRLNDLGYTNVNVHTGDGTLGYPPAAPYDRILVTAAAPAAPAALKDQLGEGGRLVIPVGSRHSTQILEIYNRIGDEFSKMKHISVVFVPLIGEDGWEE